MERVDMRDLGPARALRRHWIVALLAFGACFAVGVAAATVPEKTYRARATVSVEPTTGQQASAGVQTVNFLIPAFLERVQSRPFVERVRADLPPEALRAPVDIQASVKTGTGIVQISAESTSAAATALWANALAERLVAEELPPADEADPAPAPAPGATTTTTVQVLELSVVDPATAPTTPASPQVLPLLLGSALLGAFAALLATQVAARFQQGRDLPEQVRRYLGVPVLGEIPAVWRWRRRQVGVDQVLATQRPDVLEALKSLRVSTDLALLDERPSVVAVVSGRAGEGKSTVALVLGTALASVGRSVILVDADLRRPTLHRRAGVPLSPGLADIGTEESATLVRATRMELLGILPAGAPVGHPADAVATTLPKAVDRLGAPDRLVLIDSPPLQLAAESLQVASTAGFAVVVVRARRLRLAVLQRLVERLQGSGVVVLGVVLNGVRRRPLAKRYYGSYAATSPSLTATSAPASSRPTVPTG